MAGTITACLLPPPLPPLRHKAPRPLTTGRSVALKAAAKAQVFASPVEVGRLSVKDYVEQTEEMIRSADGGPPRWFSPLECRSQLKDSPLLLFLPGIDGVGLGLVLHHQRLGEIFDIWCLHIPIMDRTPFKDLVKLVRTTVKSQNIQSPNRPIYLVGESLGGCVALGVAAHCPDVDLVLILSNPATCFNKSQLQHLLPLLEILPSQFQVGLTYMLSLNTATMEQLMFEQTQRSHEGKKRNRSVVTQKEEGVRVSVRFGGEKLSVVGGELV